MISVLALLGKIAEFLAKGLQEASLTRASDKRGQACAAISRLYYLLVELRVLTKYMHRYAQDALESGTPSILAYMFRYVDRRIERLTNDFVETFTMVQNALDIFAPDVAAALSTVSYSKLNILWTVSQFAVVEHDGYSVARKVRFLKPDERLLNIDIGAYAKRLKNGEARERAERFEWPDRLLYYGSTDDGFSSEELTFVEMDDTKKFIDLLREHGEILDSGIAALREYIRTAFTIDEVLYERLEIEPGWFY